MKIPRWLTTVGVVTLLLFIGAWILVNRPLGPGLDLAPRAAEAAGSDASSLPIGGTVESTSSSTDLSQAVVRSQPTPLPSLTPTVPSPKSGGTCGASGTMTVLLIGEGILDGDIWFGASAIRMLNVDFDAERVRVLALPPELWVETPALAEAQITVTTPITETVLDWVYYEAKQVYSGTERAKMIYATNIFAQTLVDNFDLAPEHYVAMKQSAVSEMIDELGGLSIFIPQAIDGSPDGFGYFPAGPQVLTGQRAVNYVRIFHPAGDPDPTEWERLQRQYQVLEALYDQLTQPSMLPKLPNLARQFDDEVATDLSIAQALSLGCLLKDPDLDLEFPEIGPELVTSVSDPGVRGASFVLIPKTEEIIDFLEEEFFW